MRTVIGCFAFFLCLTPLAASTGLDGNWSADFQSRGKKAKKPIVSVTLSLTSDGKQINGTVSMGKKAIPVQEGKLDGSSFSFVTVRKGKKGRAVCSGRARWMAIRSAAQGPGKGPSAARALSASVKSESQLPNRMWSTKIHAFGLGALSCE